MADQESGNFGGSQQIDQAADQGTIAIAGAAEPEFDQNGPPNVQSAIASEIVNQLQPAPRQISEAELRVLRRLHFTVRHDRVDLCGHKLDRMNQPTTNCEYCWFVWFNSHGQLVQAVDRAFQEQGKDFVIKLRGVKFLKMFLRFMSTVAKLKAEEEQKNEEKNESNREVGDDRGSQQEAG
jgi:hypothetical protein